MSESDVTRVAVVTGANRGMGLETCRQLAERGLKVVLTSRDEARGHAAQQALKDDGIEVDYHLLDVADPASAAALASYLERRHGRLDVLVNNAAEQLVGGEGLIGADLDALGRGLDVNGVGALRVCQALVPLMVKGGYGRVVNVSGAVDPKRPGLTVAKAALNAITRLLAGELEGSGVKVNAACPGDAQTGLGPEDASLSVEEAVDTTVWLATLRDDGPTGGFFRDYKAIPW